MRKKYVVNIQTVNDIFNVLESEVELTEEEIEQICEIGQCVLEYGRGRLATEIKKLSKDVTKKLCRELREDEKVAIVAKVIQDEQMKSERGVDYGRVNEELLVIYGRKFCLGSLQ